MKILFIAIGYGGSDVALFNMIEGLRPFNIEPVVLIHGRGEIEEKLKLAGIQYSIIDYRLDVWPQCKSIFDYIKFPLRTILFPLKNQIAVGRIMSLCRSFKIDIIHTNSSTLQIGYLAAQKLKINHVWHIREYQEMDFGMKPFPSRRSLMSKLTNKNNQNIAITKGIIKHFDLPLSITTNIYDGVQYRDAIKFNDKKENYFLFVGSLTEGKGILDLINGFIEFSHVDKDYKLLIVADIGDDIFSQNVIAQVDNAGLENKIIFLGYRDDVAKLMQKATALVMPSKFEAFGLVTAEAMFNGCLVIGRNTGGTKEQFDNGLNYTGDEIGLRYESTKQLSSRLLEIKVNGVNHYYSLIDRAQITVKHMYSIEQNSKSVFNIYSSIIKNKNNEAS